MDCIGHILVFTWFAVFLILIVRPQIPPVQAEVWVDSWLLTTCWRPHLQQLYQARLLLDICTKEDEACHRNIPKSPSMTFLPLCAVPQQ